MSDSNHPKPSPSLQLHRLRLGPSRTSQLFTRPPSLPTSKRRIHQVFTPSSPSLSLSSRSSPVDSLLVSHCDSELDPIPSFEEVSLLSTSLGSRKFLPTDFRRSVVTVGDPRYVYDREGGEVGESGVPSGSESGVRVRVPGCRFHLFEKTNGLLNRVLDLRQQFDTDESESESETESLCDISILTKFEPDVAACVWVAGMQRPIIDDETETETSTIVPYAFVSRVGILSDSDSGDSSWTVEVSGGGPGGLGGQRRRKKKNVVGVAGLVSPNEKCLVVTLQKSESGGVVEVWRKPGWIPMEEVEVEVEGERHHDVRDTEAFSGSLVKSRLQMKSFPLGCVLNSHLPEMMYVRTKGLVSGVQEMNIERGKWTYKKQGTWTAPDLNATGSQQCLFVGDRNVLVIHAAVNDSNRLKIYDVRTWDCVMNFGRFSTVSSMAALSSNELLLGFAHSAGIASIVDLRKGEERLKWRVGKGAVVGLNPLPLPHVAVVSCEAGTTGLWNLAAARPKMEWNSKPVSSSSVQASLFLGRPVEGGMPRAVEVDRDAASRFGDLAGFEERRRSLSGESESPLLCAMVGLSGQGVLRLPMCFVGEGEKRVEGDFEGVTEASVLSCLLGNSVRLGRDELLPHFSFFMALGLKRHAYCVCMRTTGSSRHDLLRLRTVVRSLPQDVEVEAFRLSILNGLLSHKGHPEVTEQAPEVDSSEWKPISEVLGLKIAECPFSWEDLTSRFLRQRFDDRKDANVQLFSTTDSEVSFPCHIEILIWRLKYFHSMLAFVGHEATEFKEERTIRIDLPKDCLRSLLEFAYIGSVSSYSFRVLLTLMRFSFKHAESGLTTAVSLRLTHLMHLYGCDEVKESLRPCAALIDTDEMFSHVLATFCRHFSSPADLSELIRRGVQEGARKPEIAMVQIVSKSIEFEATNVDKVRLSISPKNAEIIVGSESILPSEVFRLEITRHSDTHDSFKLYHGSRSTKVSLENEKDEFEKLLTDILTVFGSLEDDGLVEFAL